MKKSYQIPDFPEWGNSRMTIGKVLFIGILFLFSTASFSQNSEPSNGAEKWNWSEVKLKKADVLNLFSLKPEEKGILEMVANQKPMATEILVSNHINMGENSGALACRIMLENQEARLLLNRKFRNGKLIYWMAILPQTGDHGFLIKEDTGEAFLLMKVSKDKIVTE